MASGRSPWYSLEPWQKREGQMLNATLMDTADFLKRKIEAQNIHENAMMPMQYPEAHNHWRNGLHE